MVWMGWAGTVAADEAGEFADQLTRGGRILLIRHACAPGSGDPNHLQLKIAATRVI